MRILGIDPGSINTGFGILEQNKNQPFYVASGVLRVGRKAWLARLEHIYRGLLEIIEQYQPNVVAIERVFVHQNPQTALKLGQARGAAMVACASGELTLFEYAPRQIKQAVSGYGAATKNQVQIMVQSLLKLDVLPPSDAADALAVAFCHQQMQRFLAKLQEE